MAMFTWYRESDKKTRRIFWTCSAGWAMDMADGVVYSYLIPVLVTALGMTLAQAGFISSVNYFAAALGGWIGGWLCDRYGRARILQLTILWFSLFSFLSGFVQNYEQMLVVRTLQGLGFGAEWAVGAVLLGEIITPKHRGKALGTVLHVDEVEIDFAAGYDERAAAELDAHWRLWLFDLEAESAREVRGLGATESGFNWANFETRTFVLLPYDGWARTKVFEIDAEGNATERFDTVGNVSEWLRVR